MKNLPVQFISICAFFLINQVTTINAGCPPTDEEKCKTHFSQRPQGNYQPLVMMGSADKMHLCKYDSNYFDVNATLGSRSSIGEIGAATIGQDDTFVDYCNTAIGYSADFGELFFLVGQTSEFVCCFNSFAGLNRFLPGLFTSFRVPLVSTKWDPGYCSIKKEGTGPSLKYATNESSVTVGVIGDAHTECAISDLHFELGYDFLRRKRGNAGVAAVVAAPTGVPTKDDPNRYAFPPSIRITTFLATWGSIPFPL